LNVTIAERALQRGLFNPLGRSRFHYKTS